MYNCYIDKTRTPYDQKTSIYMPYINDNITTKCIELETYYNNNFKNEYGSSYKYNVPLYYDNPQYIENFKINDITNPFKSSFNKIKKFFKSNTAYILSSICIVIIILVIISKIYFTLKIK